MYNEFECEKVITALKISHIFNGRNNAKVCIFKRAENPHPQITELTPPHTLCGYKKRRSADVKSSNCADKILNFKLPASSFNKSKNI